MNVWFVAIYFLFFAVIAGGAFAMMWGSIRNTSRDKLVQHHPETPEQGEELLYVNFSREKLEELYRKWFKRDLFLKIIYFVAYEIKFVFGWFNKNAVLFSLVGKAN